MLFAQAGVFLMKMNIFVRGLLRIDAFSCRLNFVLYRSLKGALKQCGTAGILMLRFSFENAAGAVDAFVYRTWTARDVEYESGTR